ACRPPRAPGSDRGTPGRSIVPWPPRITPPPACPAGGSTGAVSAPGKPAPPGGPGDRSRCPWATSFHHFGIDPQRSAHGIGGRLGASRGRGLLLPPEEPLEMGRVADPGMGFEAPLVLCDATTAEPDFYQGLRITIAKLGHMERFIS